MKIIPIIYFIVSLLTVSCISKFTPEIDPQARYLTVTGLITDANRRYEIKLSLSRPLGETAPVVPAKGAEVSVLDDQGNVWSFKETKPGIYLSDSTLFTGVPGQIYTLQIEHEGKQYESDPCMLRAASPIDSLGYEIYDREINASGDKEKVVRVTLNTYDPAKDNHYFRWTFLETWELHMPFNLLTYQTTVCWTSEESHSILIANTEALSEDRVTDFTLTVFNNSTDRGQYKYSMLVSQYAINYEEYEFWDNLKKVSANTGGLYDVIPAAVPGNIKCISDPDDKVLGYFSVSGVSTRRVFIRRPLIVPDLYTDKCTYELIMPNSPYPGLGIRYWAIHEFVHPELGMRWIITQDIACSDCAYFASNVKPDYWDEGFRQ
jgi:hypothetical protein